MKYKDNTKKNSKDNGLGQLRFFFYIIDKNDRENKSLTFILIYNIRVKF